jgi:two-component system NarL family sensor kinase
VRRRAGDRGDEYLDRKVLSTKLFDAYELEKKRIARDLHDGVGQILTNINLRIGQCLSSVQELNDSTVRCEAEKFLESIPDLVNEAIQEVRNVCMAIRPSELDDLGVLRAISWQCRRFAESVPGVQIETDFSLLEAEIPADLKTPIYRITQEALNNAIKHADADKIVIRLDKEDGVLSLSIEDDGDGFDPKDKLNKQALPGKTGIGLTSMKERGEALGGKLEIISGQGCGTAVCIDWPLGEPNT